jgi:hypothetical protein
MALLPLAACAQPIISAEELIKTHTSTQAGEIGEKLGVVIYDGPYDGELPPFHCDIFKSVDRQCLNYANFVPGVSTWTVLPVETTQHIEDYFYYHAYRNVNAGYFYDRENKYKTLIEDVGYSELMEVELFLLKMGRKPLTLFAQSPSKAELFKDIMEIY